MEKGSAETVVKVFSVLYFLGAAFGILVGLGFLLGGGLLGFGLGAVLGGFFGGLLAVLGVVLIIYGVLDLFVGWGLWKHKNWARITAIVLGVLGLISFPIGTIFGILVIYFFGFNEDVKGLFK